MKTVPGQGAAMATTSKEGAECGKCGRGRFPASTGHAGLESAKMTKGAHRRAIATSKATPAFIDRSIDSSHLIL